MMEAIKHIIMFLIFLKSNIFFTLKRNYHNLAFVINYLKFVPIDTSI